MKIAFVTDTHFGYRRFEADSYKQGKEAILEAAKQADVLILGGDNFDSPLPKMETLAEVTGILIEANGIFASRGIKNAIFAIHGNHERRAKGYVHPTELLAKGGFLELFHNKTIVYEKGGEKIAISGMGNVPDDLAAEALKKLECSPVPGAFNVFVVHQSFQELGIGKNDEWISHDDLPPGYDLYLCGHAHKPLLSGKVLNPGSTVVTQLREDEASKRGWLLYDTTEKKPQFMPINSRPFFFSVLDFNGATPEEIRERVAKEAKRLQAKENEPIVRIVVKGTIAKGFHSSDIGIGEFDRNTFIDNSLNSENLRHRIEQIKLAREKKLSAKEQGMAILRKKLDGTDYNLGDPEKVFESLVEGTFLQQIIEEIEKEG